MRRLAVVLSVVLSVGVWSAQAAVVETAAQAPAVLQGDFNGDGFADLAAGAPGEDVGAVAGAGVVSVLYGGVPGSPGGWSGAGSQLFSQNGAGGSAEVGDVFGDAVAVGNFNGDGFSDLAVGAPGENVGSVGDAGAVNVVYGSASGLAGAGAQQFTQDSPGVGSNAEPGDLFGAAVAVGDFNGDGFADLAVGVPLEVGVVAGGAVTVLYGSAGGLTGVGSQLFTQNSAGVGGSSENGDSFGEALAAGDFDRDGFTELAVGAPGEDVFSVVDAGAVTVLQGSAGGLTGAGSQVFTQDSPGVGGSAENGDVFGFALAAGVTLAEFSDDPGPADLAIGAPGEDVFAVADAGAATLLFGSVADGGLSGAGSQGFSQNNVGPGSSAEAGDLFGFSLAMGDFNADTGQEELNGGVDLAIGVPGENVLSVVDAGLVNVVYDDWPFFGHDNPRELLFTQPGPGAGPERGDLFGFALASTGGSLANLAVGAPGEDVDTAAGLIADVGVVSVLVGTRSFQGDGGGLVSVPGLLYQNSPGVPSSAEPGDFLGDALATSGLGPGSP